MPRLEACLVDAYDTIVTCDFTPLRHGVPALAGIPLAAWEQEYTLVSPMLNDGRLSKAQAFRQIMASCGAQATDDLIAELVRRDQELLLANARLYDDVIPFLTRLRDRGIKIAIVSNCTENTRAMLVATGVDDLADELVLSCEVGSAKPAPGKPPTPGAAPMNIFSRPDRSVSRRAASSSASGEGRLSGSR